MNISGKRALITGATGGLGIAIAEELSRRDAQLILTGRKQDVLSEVSERLGADQVVCDLNDRAAIEELHEKVGDVDILIANAGVPGSGDFNSYTLDEVDRVINVNLRSPVILARLFGSGMRERRLGQIVFISSIAGKVASPDSAMYNATKFGLRGFSLALREELHPHGVGVSCINPGFISDAGMFHLSGAKVPPLLGTKPPNAVGDAVASAIENNRCEVDVAPLTVRLGGILGGLAPDLTSKVSRRLGASNVSAEIAEGQEKQRVG